MRVSVETWKNGKRYVVARDKGRIIDRRRQTRKESLSTLKSRFNQNRSFDPNVEREVIGSARTSIAVRDKGLRRPKKNIPFHAVVSAEVIVIEGRKSKTLEISVSSEHKRWDSVASAVAQANQRFAQALNKRLGGEYDGETVDVDNVEVGEPDVQIRSFETRKKAIS